MWAEIIESAGARFNGMIYDNTFFLMLELSPNLIKVSNWTGVSQVVKKMTRLFREAKSTNILPRWTDLLFSSFSHRMFSDKKKPNCHYFKLFSRGVYNGIYSWQQQKLIEKIYLTRRKMILLYLWTTLLHQHPLSI